MSAEPFWKSHSAYCCAIFAVGFLLSWLPLALSAPVIPNPDELFQALEQGHRLAFGYGLVPWEFDHGARSWALPTLAAIPMSLAALLGLGPDFYLPLTWAFFALGAGAMSLCAGLWGARFYGRGGGLVVALVAASWIDNLYFGGRTYSEVVAAHLLIVAIFLAEPGTGMAGRNRLLAAGFIATLASMLRMQLGPVALLLWLWRWQGGARFLHLSIGAVAALLLTGLFDLLTWDYPFKPIWQNIQFNLVLDGAATFGVEPWWWYFDDAWTRWGVMAVPFLALALLGARRLPILAAMVLLTLVIHIVVPHKEYRFILPAVMMASILCGFGLVEAWAWLVRIMQGKLRESAGLAAGVAMGLLWLIVSGGNLGTMIHDRIWTGNSSILNIPLEISRRSEICGVGFANTNPYLAGGYTFLHQAVPLYFDHGDPTRLEAFVKANGAYNAMMIRRSDMDYFNSLTELRLYALDHCAQDHCLLIRPGTCAGERPQRPDVGALTRATPRDIRYPYPVGLP
jgi:hypothetical protein